MQHLIDFDKSVLSFFFNFSTLEKRMAEKKLTYVSHGSQQIPARIDPKHPSPGRI